MIVARGRDAGSRGKGGERVQTERSKQKDSKRRPQLNVVKLVGEAGTEERNCHSKRQLNRFFNPKVMRRGRREWGECLPAVRPASKHQEGDVSVGKRGKATRATLELKINGILGEGGGVLGRPEKCKEQYSTASGEYPEAKMQREGRKAAKAC